jgi:cobalt-zinc-cadmium efflux system outer membrane protein
MKLCIRYGFLGWVLLVAGPASGDPGSHTRSVETLVEEGLARHPELAYFQARLDGARDHLRLAGITDNPELEIAGGYKRSGGESGSALALSFSQPVSSPARRRVQRALADRQVEVAEAALAQFRAETAGRIRQAALAWLAAESTGRASREVAERAEDLAAIIAKRQPAGIPSVLELRMIEGNARTLRHRAVDEEREVAIRRAELNALTGRPPGAPLELAGEWPPLPVLPDNDALIARAERDNAEIRMAAAESVQAGTSVELARREAAPGYTLRPFVEREEAGEEEWVAGLGLSIPWAVRHRNDAAVASADAERRQAEAALDRTRRDVAARIVAAAEAYRLSAAEIQSWPPDWVETYRQASELSDRHYRLGSVPITTYLELHQQYLEAVEIFFEAKREAAEHLTELGMLTGVDWTTEAP